MDELSIKHRNRLFFVSALAFLVLAAGTSPVFVSEGFAAGLGVMALSSIIPLAVLVVIAYVWTGNDRAARAREITTSSKQN